MPSAAMAGTVEARPRVLVVDDEPAFAEAVAELLHESGFEARPFTTMRWPSSTWRCPA